MLDLSTTQAIDAIEELLRKLKGGEVTLVDFNLDTVDSGIPQTVEPSFVRARDPEFKITIDVRTSYESMAPIVLAAEREPAIAESDEFTLDKDGLPAVDEYAWDTNPEFTKAAKVARAERERAGEIKWPARRPSFAPAALLNADQTVNEDAASMYARWMLTPPLKSTVPVKAPKSKKPKQPFGSRDLDID